MKSLIAQLKRLLLRVKQRRFFYLIEQARYQDGNEREKLKALLQQPVFL
jgi:hypothetical protein